MRGIGDDALAAIDNAALITDLFGSWPSFHDAEVRSVLMERGDDHGPDLEATIKVFEMTPEVDSRGYYVRRHVSLVTIRFANFEDLELGEFNQQNVLMSLDLAFAGPQDPRQPARRRWEVWFRDCYGLHGHFNCESIAVRKLVPMASD